jgi:D-glycero-alpha-D-manno-heptose-7-phosphate kinase
VRIDSSAPTRIDLAGGTFDIWPLYLFHDRARTVNAAISLRAHCAIRSRDGGGISLISDDTGERVDADDPAALDLERLPLVSRLVRQFGAGGIEVRTRSESPVGAGIAGSSAMHIAVAGALAAWVGRPMTDDDLLTLAMNIEAQVIRVPTGVQDYRPALYGGIQAIELGVSGVSRVPLAVDPADLDARLVVAYTGASRNSGINNWDVMTRRINGDPRVIAAFDGIRDAAIGVQEAIERGDWTAAAGHIGCEWEHRKRLAPGVTTPAIDALLASARAAGALAGKVCGAGGGGCLFCLAPPDRREAVAAALTTGGAQVLPVTIARDGLRLVRG